MGLKLMQGFKIQDGIYCIIPHFLAYKVLKGSISVRISFNQAKESKYEIMIPFE